MSDGYTPTTKNIRDCYLYADEQFDGTLRTPANIANAEFDRWLDARDAEVKAAVLGSVATSIDLDAIANEWAGPDGSGHWSAGNAAAAVQLIMYDRAGHETRKQVPNE